jgi:hypothetical protein
VKAVLEEITGYPVRAVAVGANHDDGAVSIEFIQPERGLVHGDVQTSGDTDLSPFPGFATIEEKEIGGVAVGPLRQEFIDADFRDNRLRLRGRSRTGRGGRGLGASAEGLFEGMPEAHRCSSRGE